MKITEEELAHASCPESDVVFLEIYRQEETDDIDTDDYDMPDDFTVHLVDGRYIGICSKEQLPLVHEFYKGLGYIHRPMEKLPDGCYQLRTDYEKDRWLFIFTHDKITHFVYPY